MLLLPRVTPSEGPSQGCRPGLTDHATMRLRPGGIFRKIHTNKTYSSPVLSDPSGWPIQWMEARSYCICDSNASIQIFFYLKSTTTTRYMLLLPLYAPSVLGILPIRPIQWMQARSHGMGGNKLRSGFALR